VLEPEEDPYYEVETYCSNLKEQGDLLGAVAYLQEASADETDTRYADLLAQYEADLISQTLASAESQANNSQYRLALQTLSQMQQSYDCQAFADAATEYKNVLGKHTITAGVRYSVAINSDGTVKMAGTPKTGHTPCSTSSWSNVISIAVGDSHIIGLCEDGTVLGTGPVERQHAVTTWTDIVAIAAGDTHSVGLMANGTVVATGENFKGECNVQGLYTESPVVAIAAGYEFTVALHADGTVSAVGDNSYGQCNVRDWQDVVAISAGTSHTLGVTSDGRVLAAGSNDEGQCNVHGWSDIAAVSAGDYFTVGLRSDGTVVAVGINAMGQCNVGSWRSIVEIAGGNHQTLGRDIYGDLVSIGGNQYKQRDFTN
jgi:alpha-tubulin suppressor-like RCC1 family protein